MIVATSKKLVIEIATEKGSTKSFTFKNPKSGITRQQAESFAEFLYDNNILDPTTLGVAGSITKAYYEETTTTDLT